VPLLHLSPNVTFCCNPDAGSKSGSVQAGHVGSLVGDAVVGDDVGDKVGDGVG
jgi:hypothetical protein